MLYILSIVFIVKDIRHWYVYFVNILFIFTKELVQLRLLRPVSVGALRYLPILVGAILLLLILLKCKSKKPFIILGSIWCFLEFFSILYSKIVAQNMDRIIGFLDDLSKITEVMFAFNASKVILNYMSSVLLALVVVICFFLQNKRVNYTIQNNNNPINSFEK